MFKFCCICVGKDRQNRPIKEVFAVAFRTVWRECGIFCVMLGCPSRLFFVTL
ncbi:hypothetical protein HMPREF9442_01631 [Paraprevotella xylaniphila YIT 11841]|uniref:Uncharacterized protein n=1 Tax=Paraprevotella xylaniphila YIT 11841 TaxID=762982 RepID=F3QTW2_9BACT|nr:hypothetical protein HMPREF9442_01631 [Paraprevotella xylaniphila YIT 11841]